MTPEEKTNRLTVLGDDDLAHLLQSCDEQLVGHNQHIADKLYIQTLCRTKRGPVNMSVFTAKI